MSGKGEILGFSDFDCMSVGIIEPKDALSPCLPLDGMYQLYLWVDFFEGRVNVLMFEV